MGKVRNVNEKIENERIKASKQIYDASVEFGSFYVSGIPNFNKQYFNDILQSGHNIFKSDENIKQQLQDKGTGFTRGFLNFGTESGSQLFENKEGNCLLSLFVFIPFFFWIAKLRICGFFVRSYKNTHTHN